MYSIDPRKTCDCPKPLPSSRYLNFKVCRLCSCLIPHNQEMRLALSEERANWERREGLRDWLPTEKSA